jgi:hypothetical protein
MLLSAMQGVVACACRAPRAVIADRGYGEAAGGRDRAQYSAAGADDTMWGGCLSGDAAHVSPVG